MIEKMLEQINKGLREFEFPVWDCGDGVIITGAMKMIGFWHKEGIGMVFEVICYSKDENLIKNESYCFATYPVKHWFDNGNKIFINFNTDGDFNDVFSVKIDGREYPIRADGNVYPDDKVKRVLYAMCDQLPEEALFSDPGIFIEKFNLLPGSKIIFQFRDWKHPVLEESYSDDIGLDNNNDVYKAIISLANGKSPDLGNKPNTHWKAQCGHVDK